jgi:nucleotide-binding universal stress UspA family protein
MLKVLIPVDGSPNGLLAVRHVIHEYQRHHDLEIHLLNVQPRFSRHVARFVSRHDRDAWHSDKAQLAMAGSSDLLSRAGVPCHPQWIVGELATEICRCAQRLGVHYIVMGTSRKNSITRMLEDSVTTRVLEATTVPVEIVAGNAISKWERWGLPAGVAFVGGLMLLSLD